MSHFQNVNVEVLAKNHSHGSSMVKLKNIVDYKWEEKNYPGHLIASHKDGKVIAYSINGKLIFKRSRRSFIHV